MQQQDRMLRLGVIGVPTNSSGTTDGVAHAPRALRQAGLIDALQQRHDTKDYGDVTILAPTPQRSRTSGIIAEQSLISMTDDLQRIIGQALSEGRFPLVIGGDCPVLLGCLAAVCTLFSQSGLLFVDGHEDAYAPHDSLTGEAADMELGLALGLVSPPGLATDLAKLLPLVRPSEVAILGARDAPILHAEGVASLAPKIELYDDQALQKGPLEEITHRALEHIKAGASHWWLHVDLDVLSTEALPAIDYPQPGGLSWAQLETVTTPAMTVDALVGCDVTIYNSDLDPDGSQAVRIVEYLQTATMHLAAHLR